jgi:hypothetical protein
VPVRQPAGVYYWREGDTQYEQIARHHTQRALDIYLATVGEDHPEAVAALVEYSVLLTGADGRREARRILDRILFGGPTPGSLVDADDPAGRAGSGCHVRSEGGTVLVRTFARGGLGCGSDAFVTLDLRPRLGDPAPHLEGVNMDQGNYPATLFAPPLDADPFVDNVHAAFRLWKVFEPGTKRAGMSLSIHSAPRACAWPSTGYELRFVEPLFVERTDDPDVCRVTTRHPTDPMLDVDQAQLERHGEVLATYRIPLTWRIERAP